jgi:hypothetical protein
MMELELEQDGWIRGRECHGITLDPDRTKRDYLTDILRYWCLVTSYTRHLTPYQATFRHPSHISGMSWPRLGRSPSLP